MFESARSSARTGPSSVVSGSDVFINSDHLQRKRAPNANDNDDDSDTDDVDDDQRNAEAGTCREICLSICLAGNRIGAAYYDYEYGRINLFEDAIEDYSHCTVLKALIEQVQPAAVLAGSRQDDKVLYHLKQLCTPSAATTAASTTDCDVSEVVEKPRLVFLRSREYALPACRKRICMIISNSSDSNKDFFINNDESNRSVKDSYFGEETRLRAAFVVNFDSVCMVRAFGALLKYLNLRQLREPQDERSLTLLDDEHEDDEAAVENEEQINNSGILAIKTFTLKKALKIDGSTFVALQIFENQYHPSVFKVGRVGLKEGFSLFGLCNKCRSSVGSMELRRWFSRPLSDASVLQKRLDAIEFLMIDSNNEFVDSMKKVIQHVGQLPAILTRMQLSKVSVNDWTNIYRTLFNCCRLSDLIYMREKRPLLLTELADSVSEVVQEVCILLCRIIDFEGLQKEKRFVVRRNIDPELDNRKAFYETLPVYLTRIAEKEMEWLDVPECSVVYMPMLGYLLTIPKSESTDQDSEYDRQGLEFLFVANDMIHYKTEMTRNLDQRLGDVRFKIIDRETSIMLNLERVILEQAGPLLDSVQAVAQVDCLISLASAARAFNWTKPKLVNENIINIKDGRHPLLDVVSSSHQFVANGIRSGFMGNRLKRPANGQATCFRAKLHLMTGPNASGKSVYLKQSGLLVYLAHIGSFVPAAAAEIGLLDGIYSRIRTLDSMSDGLSAFAADVRQMSLALSNATGHSLVLIDEFGKGSATEVGVCLLGASLNYWIEKADECPHVFVSSHMYSIMGLLPASPLISCLTMNVLKRGAELVFLYKLVEGVIDTSHAVHTAESAGLPKPILERAVQVINDIRAGNRIRRDNLSEEEFINEYEKTKRLVDKFVALDLNKSQELRPAVKSMVYDTDITLSPAVGANNSSPVSERTSPSSKVTSTDRESA